MGVLCDARMVKELVFLPPGTPETAPSSALAAQAAEALHAWIADPERPHGLPLAQAGTAFQRRVWTAIAAIPCGRTRRYSDLARELGSAARAVGGACGANPFPLIVPCHRVVSSQGLGGFAGDTDGHLIRVKKWLLAHEAGLAE
ncbi:MAG: methylated-DNA--[protein]-cysteine S-methyltransferase [Zoogloeaceae bacterium]|nr:methylated-DNA--[protein]-cysteine S-methyltransferase [Zoogloeaceae bacterium]